MRIEITDRLETAAPFSQSWDELAGGCTFRTWDWVSLWWKHYVQDVPERTAWVVLLIDEHEETSRLVAALPTYIEHTQGRGNVLRLMGDGEVCSDHLGLLVDSRLTTEASRQVAEALFNRRSEWDLIDLQAVSSEDQATQLLTASLGELGCRVAANAGPSTWAIELPGDWEEFLAMQSKSHRKQLRRGERRFERAVDSCWKLAETEGEYVDSWETFVELHQKRRQSLGEAGCFSSRRYSDFHAELSKRLYETGKLRLSTTTYEGRAIAAEYQFIGGDTAFAYQGGIEPEAQSEGPGALSLTCAIKHAISEGIRTLDFLRGDEPYKAHWRASPRCTHNIEIVPPRSTAVLRYRAWSSLRSTKRWLTGNPLGAAVDATAYGASAT